MSEMGEGLQDPRAQRGSFGEEGLQFWLISEVTLQLLVQRCEVIAKLEFLAL